VRGSWPLTNVGARALLAVGGGGSTEREAIRSGEADQSAGEAGGVVR